MSSPSDHLSHLFGAYFHEDWSLEAKDWQGIVQLYRSHASKEDLASTAAALRELLSRNLPDPSIEQLLNTQFGCCYTPRPDLGGPSYSVWLGQVLESLDS